MRKESTLRRRKRRHREWSNKATDKWEYVSCHRGAKSKEGTMRLLVKVCVVLVVLMVAAQAHAAVIKVSAESATLRANASTSGGVVTTVPKGTLLGVLEEQGFWIKVKVLQTGDVGYIHKALVESSVETPPVRSGSYVAPAASAPASRAPAARSTSSPPAYTPSSSSSSLRESAFAAGTMCGDLDLQLDMAYQKKASGKKKMIIGGVIAGATTLIASMAGGTVGYYAALAGGGITAWGAMEFNSSNTEVLRLEREGRANKCWALVPTRDGVAAAMQLSW
jgi:hypothetical protein